MAESIAYLRGAFIAYEPDGYPEQKRTIPFRFNPESLSRQLSVEQGKGQSGAAGGAGGGSAGSEESADASSGSLKQALTLLIRVDAVDRGGSVAQLPPELGVAPEIAALEDLMHPGASESDANADGSEPVEARPRLPTVLFVWGRKRVYPVRVTGMTIEETLHNSRLNPIRAEIEVSLEVLGDSEVKGNLAVDAALQFTSKNRREMAKLFLDKTADQSTNILPL